MLQAESPSFWPWAAERTLILERQASSPLYLQPPGGPDVLTTPATRMALSILLLVLLCWTRETASLAAPNPVQQLMLGRYDNKLQADTDLARGKPTAALGGHEYVTASITAHPHLPTVLLAQYYFGADPLKTFRLRCYEFVPPAPAPASSASAAPASVSGPFRMRLYRPLPATEAAMRAAGYDLLSSSVQGLPSFAPALASVPPADADAAAATGVETGVDTGVETVDETGGVAGAGDGSVPPPLRPLLSGFEYLSGCDVCWAPAPSATPYAAPSTSSSASEGASDAASVAAPAVVGRGAWRLLLPRLVSFLPFISNTPKINNLNTNTNTPSPDPSPGFRGTLYEGSCSLCSQTDPNVMLTVKDDLGLYLDRLEINDRVYNAQGRMVIGNSEGVPYCLVRQ